MTQSALQLPTAGTLGGLAMVQGINAALAGLSSFLQGPAAPTAAGLDLPNLVGVGWHDTATGTLKIRDQADTAWIVIGTFDENNKVFVPAAIDTDGALAGNSDTKIPSQKAVKIFALPASYLDTDGALSANSDSKVASQKAVKTYVTAQLSGLTVTDLVARDQIALTNLRLMLNTSISTGALIQGKQWELTTDEWGSSSTGQAFVTSSVNYYANIPSLSGSTAAITAGMLTSTGFNAFSAAQMVNGTTAASEGGYPVASTAAGGCCVVIDYGSPIALGKWDTYCQTAPSSSGWKVAYSDNGSSWTDTDVSAANFAVGQWNAQTWSYVGAHRYWKKYNSLTAASDQGWHSELRAYAFSVSTDMTLLPPSSVTLSAAPSYADAYFLWKDDSGAAVLGTDLTVELSRDGGTTWTVASITNPLGAGGFDGTYTVLRARASVSGQPSGTSLKARIKTLNNKAQRVAAPALYAE